VTISEHMYQTRALEILKGDVGPLSKIHYTYKFTLT